MGVEHKESGSAGPIGIDIGGGVRKGGESLSTLLEDAGGVRKGVGDIGGARVLFEGERGGDGEEERVCTCRSLCIYERDSPDRRPSWNVRTLDDDPEESGSTGLIGISLSSSVDGTSFHDRRFDGLPRIGLMLTPFSFVDPRLSPAFSYAPSTLS